MVSWSYCQSYLLSRANLRYLPHYIHNPEFHNVQTKCCKVVCECVRNPIYDMYTLSGNFGSFLDLLSTRTVCRPPNFNSTFLLVSTFIIQSFIMYRQSVGNLVSLYIVLVKNAYQTLTSTTQLPSNSLTLLECIPNCDLYYSTVIKQVNLAGIKQP